MIDENERVYPLLHNREASPARMKKTHARGITEWMFLLKNSLYARISERLRQPILHVTLQDLLRIIIRQLVTSLLRFMGAEMWRLFRYASRRSSKWSCHRVPGRCRFSGLQWKAALSQGFIYLQATAFPLRCANWWNRPEASFFQSSRRDCVIDLVSTGLDNSFLFCRSSSLLRMT